ncbi:hypothetical protein NNO_0812 [Hydrogenimonas sp.]|nr:hypothetical protein NNO_0812 [Hydrogenimonas sp.]
MKSARGFRGRYFTLAAIQALSSEKRLHALESSFVSRAAISTLFAGRESDDPPDEEFESDCAGGRRRDDSKPCHCNCYFRRVAWLLFHLSKFFRRSLCRCRKTKTGLAPPPLTEMK